jgi:glycogen synthase
MRHLANMNVVFVVPRFYPYKGGYENYILKLATHLRLLGNTVTVLTSTALDLEAFWLKGFHTTEPGTEELEGVLIRRFPIDYRKWVRRSGRILALAGTWRMKAKFAAPGFHVHGLASAIREAKPDIVHIGPLPYTRLMYEGLREGAHCHARVVATPCTHFGEDRSNAVARHYTQPAQIKLLNHCDALLALTHVEQRGLVQCGVQSEKIRVTQLGIDLATVTGGEPERFRTRHNVQGPIVLQLGTKAGDKGTIAVVEGMKRLWAEQLSATLVLAGATTTEFESYLQHQPPMPRLLNLAPISEDEKRDLLAAATILVNPSRVESFGIVYLEAWANGKAVIGADIPVTREVIEHGRDGLLVRFGDPEAIAHAVRRLLQDPSLANGMGQSGCAKVKARFRWEAVLPKITESFCES